MVALLASTRRGVEQPSDFPAKIEVPTQDGAKCGALLGDSDVAPTVDSTGHDSQSVAADVDLSEVVDRWSSLPDAIRIAILALVRMAC